MRADGAGKKKLRVAFHFQFANQAGWECDGCRKAGLETRRRCGWKRAGPETPERVVWARKTASCASCPVSYISAQSAAWVEEFFVRKRLGFREPGNTPARDVEAFLILEREWEAEREGRGGTDAG